LDRLLKLKIAAACVIAALLVLYFAGQSHNPPGHDADESSIAYNALMISRGGVDEYGVSFPLYFRSFGEYKNPVYIYLLSGVFKVIGPTALTPRRLSATLGIGAALVLGWLAWKVTKRGSVAVLTTVFAALTPLLFEVSRLALEVAMFPIVVALFLVAARRAYEQPRWNARLIVALVATLVLVTYTYTAGRMLGPVFALLLVLFATRERAKALAAVWLLFGIMLVPMFVVNARVDGVLLHRPSVELDAHVTDATAWTYVKQYAANLDPIRFGVRGDPNWFHHVPGSGGSILLMTPLLAVIGIAIAFRDRWTWFLVAAALAAVVPVAMTINVHHALRLTGYVVLLNALAIPAIALLVRRDVSRPLRALVAVAVVAGALQAAFFFTVFHRDGAKRKFDFHAGAQAAIDDALDQPPRPIYMTPGPGYVHAYWYGALRGAKPTDFATIPAGVKPPPGSIVLAGTFPPPGGIPIGRHGRFGAYFVP
jgi:4-amino-4-deoxy-L-arabinose transferase-like glycosyltransferase